MNIKNMFTNFLATDFLSVDNKLIEEFCYKEKDTTSGRVISNDGGWQSNNVIHAPELGPLIKELGNNILKVHDHFNFKLDKNPVITDAWININGKYTTNVVHKHPGALLSGVYYVKANADSGNIIFLNPIEAHEYVIKSDMYDLNNEFNSAKWWEEPYPSKLIIFPGWLNHYVKANQSNEDRISIAFNTTIEL
jgi:uncharacterized protein (TIGR02466 family)